jgi:hypothetical protein
MGYLTISLINDSKQKAPRGANDSSWLPIVYILCEFSQDYKKARYGLAATLELQKVKDGQTD